MAELAEAGDVLTARVWLDFVVGETPQAVELTRADGESLAALDCARVQAAIPGAPPPCGEARLAEAPSHRSLTDEPRGDAG